ncbi:hypothetical protein HMPREF0973_01399 [Prevotella veroralis F0319]|uniref:Uncharacterized protein n=1 Tax=Prevotella veroralis F0319 TaxID=649761 RepID=C9MP61_9BACT|nr:hypothetical protein HMPREF0973_01399 [Prevotella veroralis F0319]
MKKAFLYLKNMPTCRDRRPRLSARARQICNQLPRFMRTDEGVCPYFVVSFCIERTIPISFR